VDADEQRGLADGIVDAGDGLDDPKLQLHGKRERGNADGYDHGGWADVHGDPERSHRKRDAGKDDGHGDCNRSHGQDVSGDRECVRLYVDSNEQRGVVDDYGGCIDYRQRYGDIQRSGKHECK
jgi:hypothetical protein